MQDSLGGEESRKGNKLCYQNSSFVREAEKEGRGIEIERKDNKRIQQRINKT